jgi:serine protease Do
MKSVRYAYAATTALLLTGSALALVNGSPVTAQTALPVSAQANLAPAGAPASFADLVAQLQPAVVNISTKQKVQVATSFNPFTGERRPVTQERLHRHE